MEPTRFIPSQCSFVFAGACCISVCLLTSVFSFHVHLLTQNIVLWNTAIILNHLRSRTMYKHAVKARVTFLFMYVMKSLTWILTLSPIVLGFQLSNSVNYLAIEHMTVA